MTLQFKPHAHVTPRSLAIQRALTLVASLLALALVPFVIRSESQAKTPPPAGASAPPAIRANRTIISAQSSVSQVAEHSVRGASATEDAPSAGLRTISAPSSPLSEQAAHWLARGQHQQARALYQRLAERSDIYRVAARCLEREAAP
jgi:hypothetical protein